MVCHIHSAIATTVRARCHSRHVATFQCETAHHVAVAAQIRVGIHIQDERTPSLPRRTIPRERSIGQRNHHSTIQIYRHAAIHPVLCRCTLYLHIFQIGGNHLAWHHIIKHQPCIRTIQIDRSRQNRCIIVNDVYIRGCAERHSLVFQLDIIHLLDTPFVGIDRRHIVLLRRLYVGRSGRDDAERGMGTLMLVVIHTHVSVILGTTVNSQSRIRVALVPQISIHAHFRRPFESIGVRLRLLQQHTVVVRRGSGKVVARTLVLQIHIARRTRSFSHERIVAGIALRAKSRQRRTIACLVQSQILVIDIESDVIFRSCLKAISPSTDRRPKAQNQSK